MQNWTHKKWCRPSDPINVIFKGIDLDEIRDFLVAEGWGPPPLFGIGPLRRKVAEDQVILDSDLLSKRIQDLELIKPPESIYERFHIRLWHIEEENRIVANVHFDSVQPGLRLRHSVSDFESVEKYFARLCKRNPYWNVAEDREDLDNYFAGHGLPYNNGKATVITKKNAEPVHADEGLQLGRARAQSPNQKRQRARSNALTFFSMLKAVSRSGTFEGSSSPIMRVIDMRIQECQQKVAEA